MIPVVLHVHISQAAIKVQMAHQQGAQDRQKEHTTCTNHTVHWKNGEQSSTHTKAPHRHIKIHQIHKENCMKTHTHTHGAAWAQDKDSAVPRLSTDRTVKEKDMHESEGNHEGHRPFIKTDCGNHWEQIAFVESNAMLWQCAWWNALYVV